MNDISDRLDRVESLVEQQQETITQQEQRIDDQQETIEQQRERIEQQTEIIEELRSDDQTDSGAASGDASISRRGAMKTAGLVGLVGAGAGAATAGPTIGDPSNQVETLYAESLAGSLTGGTTVTDLVGGGLAINSGSLEPALSSDLTLSNGALAVDVGPGDVGAAPETHDNTAHAQNYAVDGATQPPETHGNAAHVQSYAVEGTEQPPENHGNEAHSSEFATSGEVPTSPGDIGAASNSHGNEAHSTTFVSSLSGGAGIDQGTIGNGDTISVDWSDANDLDASGNVSGAGPDPGRFLEIDFDDKLSFAPSAEWTGTSATINDVSGSFSASLSGTENDVDCDQTSVICGGDRNEILNGSIAHAGILAGQDNTVDTDATASVIAGGVENQISGPDLNNGNNNEAFIGAGDSNAISGDNGLHCAIAAGFDNTISGGINDFIGAGANNSINRSSNAGPADAGSAFIGAGSGNSVRSDSGSVVTGRENEVSAPFGSVLTGEGNAVTGRHGAVLAGEGNSVQGAYSVAAGRNATAESPGAFVFADDSEAELRADGPGLYTQGKTHAPEFNRTVSGRELNTDQFDGEATLERLTGIDVGTVDGDLRLDPAAFNEAFDLDGDGLGTLDVDAALVAAVQALAAEVERLKQGSVDNTE